MRSASQWDYSSPESAVSIKYMNGEIITFFCGKEVEKGKQADKLILFSG